MAVIAVFVIFCTHTYKFTCAAEINPMKLYTAICWKKHRIRSLQKDKTYAVVGMKIYMILPAGGCKRNYKINFILAVLTIFCSV